MIPQIETILYCMMKQREREKFEHYQKKNHLSLFYNQQSSSLWGPKKGPKVIEIKTPEVSPGRL